MPPSSKPGESKRKSGGKPSLVVTLAASPERLREILESSDTDTKAQTPTTEVKKADAPASPAGSGSGNASDSKAPTPAPDGTPVASSMGPPADGPKKKGVKRGPPAANNDGIPKPRGKPGPKKKPRLEDGTIDHAGAGARAAAGAHKLGPKANQGAINAGLRALDRSGKPCRRWQKGGFQLKSFTGVVWGINRWSREPQVGVMESSPDSTAQSADTSSSKENKGEDQVNGAGINGDKATGENNDTPADVEMASPSVPSSSPAPAAIAAAS